MGLFENRQSRSQSGKTSHPHQPGLCPSHAWPRQQHLQIYGHCHSLRSPERDRHCSPAQRRSRLIRSRLTSGTIFGSRPEGQASTSERWSQPGTTNSLLLKGWGQGQGNRPSSQSEWAFLSGSSWTCPNSCKNHRRQQPGAPTNEGR